MVIPQRRPRCQSSPLERGSRTQPMITRAERSSPCFRQSTITSDTPSTWRATAPSSFLPSKDWLVTPANPDRKPFPGLLGLELQAQGQVVAQRGSAFLCETNSDRLVI